MAETLTVELDDKGNIGKLPEPLQKFLDSRISEAFGKGAKKVEDEYKGKLADPAEKERLRALEDENNRLKEAEARVNKNFEEADRLKEERYKKTLEEKDGVLTAKESEIARRDQRLRASLGSEIKAAATAAGARAESLPELVKLLGADLDLDADLNPIVKGADGKPLTKDNKAVTIEGYVTQYLADHPHHIGRSAGKSGRASGGATFHGGGRGSEADEAFASLKSEPNIRNLAQSIRASRTKAS